MHQEVDVANLNLKYASEALGTFILILFGAGACILAETGFGINHLGVSITFGLTVFAMVWAFGKVSGAHINPAVSLAFYLQRKIPTREFLGYVSFQTLGAILAGLVLFFTFPESEGLGGTYPSGAPMESFWTEVWLSFLLMVVILWAISIHKNIIFIALWIGAIVGLDAYFGGPISGASMNPARSIGPALVSLNLDHIWIYILAPCLGTTAAVGAFQLIKRIK